MTFFHGIQVAEPVDGVRPILEKSTAVIGLVATATAANGQPTADLNAAFPLDRPVLITDVRAALAHAGDGGTLATALGRIANQGSPLVVVVRVGIGVASEGVTAQQDQNAKCIGGSVNGSYTGMQALLVAESIVGVRPRILGAPGLDLQPVTAAMVIVAKRLRAMVYAAARGSTIGDAIDFREDFADRELCLIWPFAAQGDGHMTANALGLRAMLDETIGWHKSLSNVPIAGVTGLSRDVAFDIRDSSSDAGVLNQAAITTVVRTTGYRFWGNRTCSDEPLFAFETATRSAQAIQDVIADGLMWAVDKPMTLGLIRDVIETGNAQLRLWSTPGTQQRLIGGKMWFDPSVNPPEQLAAGKLIIDYDFTPIAPLEGLQLNQRITSRYYAGFGDELPSA